MNARVIVSVVAVLIAISTACAGAKDLSSKIGPQLRFLPSKAEAIYRKRLSEDTTGDAYAGLATALCLQDKIREAEEVIDTARQKGFAGDPSVLAATAFINASNAQKSVGADAKALYDDVAFTSAQTALKLDPSNEVAREALQMVEQDRRKYSKPRLRIHGDSRLGDFGSSQQLFSPGGGLVRTGL